MSKAIEEKKLNVVTKRLSREFDLYFNCWKST